MLNPVLSNVRIIIGEGFFPDSIMSKYDSYLQSIKFPFRTASAYVHETIQNIEVPGIDLKTLEIEALANNKLYGPGSENFQPTTHTEAYQGSAGYSDILSNRVVNITFKNTILNWMIMFDICYNMYKRVSPLAPSYLSVIMMNSAEIPMLQFKMDRAFISSLPALSFANNSSFSESKTFDVSFTFNQLDVKFLLPELNRETFSLG